MIICSIVVCTYTLTTVFELSHLKLHCIINCSVELNSIVVNWINNDTVHGINAPDAWIVFTGSHNQAVSHL